MIIKNYKEYSPKIERNITKYGDTIFTYSTWIKDLLTKVGDKKIEYDTKTIFNPAKYGNKCFEYKERRLVKFTDSLQKNYYYKYIDKGLRIKKIYSVETNYYYENNNLVSLSSPYYNLYFLYGFTKDGDKYFYIRDVFQNILGIADENGNVVVRYEYDAFGKLLSISGSKAESIGRINPFRYKGYFYDKESKMYYCKSRYYVPEWGRWLNIDSPLFIENEYSYY